MFKIKCEYDTVAAAKLNLARQGEVYVEFTDSDLVGVPVEVCEKLAYFAQKPFPCGRVVHGTAREVVELATDWVADEAKQAQEKKDKYEAAVAAILDALPDERIAVSNRYNQWERAFRIGDVAGLRDYPSAWDDPRVKDARDAADTECERRNAEREAAAKAASEALQKQESARLEAEKVRQKAQEAEDLAWAVQHGSSLLQRHVAEGVRGTRLRKAVREEQIVLDLAPVDWLPANDLVGDESAVGERLPPQEVYDALDAAKTIDCLSNVKITRWQDWAACRDGGCGDCDADGEHKRWRWALKAQWRGEVVVQIVE